MTANSDGRPIYPNFQFLPSKRRYPEYFSVIDSPIDLKIIAQKIQGGEYSNLNDLERDLLLLVRNACLFNEPGSQIYKDAKTLKKVNIILFFFHSFVFLLYSTYNDTAFFLFQIFLSSAIQHIMS